ncbi:MAG: ATP-binding protein [Bacteroidetes bacterium]|nr:ATP-binding protein [Bacteroidota bacterium]
MEKELNPFLVTSYKNAFHFCNREFETEQLKKNIQNNVNTSLFAIRRVGKTALIQHVFNYYAKNPKVVCIYVDILGSLNLKEFTNQLATVIYNRFPENKSIGKKIISAIKLLRPSISFDDFSGTPEIKFDFIEHKAYEKTIQQLFSFLDQQNLKIIFAIDEFQQILEFPEKNVEAILRTHMQSLKHTHFIFCGSNQKMMYEIFNGVKRPFFGSCSNMHLDFISETKYATFIEKIFTHYKRKIDKESIRFVLSFTCCHTFYTQYFCNYLFAIGKKSVQLDVVKKIALEILKLYEPTFFQYRNLLTAAQWQLLSAISKEEKLFKAHSADFIKKYNLGTSSMVSRGLEALLEKEMIFFNSTVEKPYYETYDKFLMRWVQIK